MEDKWKEIEEHFEFIHRNLDICCQDLCSGQEAKFKLERVMELLADIRNELT